MSPELSQVVNMVTKADGTDANAQLRGVGPDAGRSADRRAQVQSRHARAGGRPGREETVRRSRGRQSGRAANNLWTVVGTFASGDAHDSELWADSETVANTTVLPRFSP